MNAIKIIELGPLSDINYITEDLRGHNTFKLIYQSVECLITLNDQVLGEQPVNIDQNENIIKVPNMIFKSMLVIRAELKKSDD